jgi:hypothetical protein
MKASEAMCSRCRRMGLECVVNKSLQTLLEDEAEWVPYLQCLPLQHITNWAGYDRWKSMIEAAMTDLLRKSQLPELSYYQAGGGSIETPSNKRGRKDSTVSTDDNGFAQHSRTETIESTVKSGTASRSNYGFPQQHPRYALDREETGATSLVTAPMGSLYEVTQLSENRESSPGQELAPDQALVTDLISRGVVDIQEAEELFYQFDQVLNRYLWDGALLAHKDLTSVRRSSSMLSAAIMAVTALHMPTKERTFDTCYTEFARLASDSMLGHHHTLDDIRALCIGAFWLADVSWKLSGYAVRIATERNLHQFFRKATQGSPEHIEQARLWYLLYVSSFDPKRRCFCSYTF